jgi:hypothetical protein
MIGKALVAVIRTTSELIQIIPQIVNALRAILEFSEGNGKGV